MSEYTIVKCDECATTTDDPYKERGWIVLEASLGNPVLWVLFGRTANGEAQVKRILGDEMRYDFCSTKCFEFFLSKKILKDAK